MRKLILACMPVLMSSLALAADRPKLALDALPPGDVKLLDGPYKVRQDAAVKYLLSLEPDRLLARFRTDAGLTPKAEGYAGWEARGVSGHSLGHYLTAVAFAYAATGDAEFKRRADYIVAELAEVQAANGDGYAQAIPEGKRVFAEVKRGEINTENFGLNGLWVPWYTVHKVLAGLRDAHALCGNAQAKDVLVKHADWVDATVGHLPDAQVQRMLDAEHGGMNEVLFDVYALTGEEKYKRLAGKFHHDAVLDPLAKGEERVLVGKHSNTQVPKLVGLARGYEVTGDDAMARASANFWKFMVADHTYVTGGNSDGEHLGLPDELHRRLGENTAETCNTNNMLKLTDRLFARTGDARYAEYAEQASVNHILASQDPATGRVTYFCTVKPGAARMWQRLYDDFTCCVGTGMENHVKYNTFVYYATPTDDALVVAQYVGSEARWADKGVTVRQETRFPEEARSTLTLDVDGPTEFALKLRVPQWAQDGFAVRVNDEATRAKIDDGFATIARTWQDGDVVEVALPMTLRAEPMPDADDKLSVRYGPVVLAAKVDATESELLLPTLVEADAGDKVGWAEPVAGEPMAFRTKGVARPDDVTLVPYYAATEGGTVVYFDRFDKADWAAREAEYRAELARVADVKRRTVDVLVVGEMQPERDHNLTGERTESGQMFHRYKWRHATDGGHFAFDMKVRPAGKPQQLVLTYWGSDGGNRTFDILVDDQKLATEKLEAKSPGKLFDVAYDLPAEAMGQGKDTVRVKLQAHPGQTAGGIFGARVVEKE